MKNLKTFQSYLILGDEETRFQRIEEIASDLQVSLNSNSPDISVIKPEDNNKLQSSISIGVVRQLKKYIYQKPVANPFKIIRVTDANKLTQEAQNALLKILEEPPEHAILILEAPNTFHFLPTIISRVVIVNAGAEKLTAQESFLDSNITQNLMNLNNVTDARVYLDQQMTTVYKELVSSLQKTGAFPKKQISAIYSLVTAKKMIEANINPRFVLADLFLKTNL